MSLQHTEITVGFISSLLRVAEGSAINLTGVLTLSGRSSVGLDIYMFARDGSATGLSLLPLM